MSIGTRLSHETFASAIGVEVCEIGFQRSLLRR